MIFDVLYALENIFPSQARYGRVFSDVGRTQIHLLPARGLSIKRLRQSDFVEPYRRRHLLKMQATVFLLALAAVLVCNAFAAISTLYVFYFLYAYGVYTRPTQPPTLSRTGKRVPAKVR